MKAIILLLLVVLGSMSARAQHSSFMMSYPVSFPMGDLHSYIDKPSFRGISFEFNKAISHESMAGLEVGWNVFYQHVAKQEYKDNTASLTGVQYRYINAVPIILGVKHFIHTEGKAAHPFIGLGAGTVYVERATNFGLYQIYNDAWQFCLRPELGVDLRFSHNESMFFAAKYFWNFNTSSLDGQSWLSLNVGVHVSM